MLKFYGYSRCSTCIKVKSFLKNKDVSFQDIDILSQPPSINLLRSILRSGDYTINDLFNRSGILYRQLNMKDKIGKLPEKELLDLLSHNGKLIKRPIIEYGKRYIVGLNLDKLNKIF